jgi:glycopeptide antibiotics resistance protein
MTGLSRTRAVFGRREKGFALLTAAVAAAIVIGCLSPFKFAIPHHGPGPIRHLAASWAKPPFAVDFIFNVVLYLPLGMFGSLSVRKSSGARFRIAAVTIGGALLSVAIELTQYYDTSRFSAASDLYANALGTFVGAATIVAVLRR